MCEITLKFNIPFAADFTKSRFVTLTQSGRVVVGKTTEDCEKDGKASVCKQTQREMQLLDPKKNGDIRRRVKTKDGKVHKSEVFTETVEQLMKDGEN